MKINVTPDVEIFVEELLGMFHPNNSQVRDEEEQLAIRKSLEENGLIGELIIVNRWNMKIISGHGRVQACWDIGYRGRLPVVYEEIKSEIGHRRRMLQCNRARGHQDGESETIEVLALVEEYGKPQIAAELAYSADELNALISGANTAPTTVAGDPGIGMGGGSGQGEEVTCPSCGHTFSR